MSSTPRKSAFVSGAGRNIGRAIVLELADQGMNVAINGHSDRAACEEVAAAAKAKGVETMVVMGDVGKSAEVARMAKEVLARFGSVQVLVNNAAIRPEKPFLEMSDEDWHRVLDVDLNSAFYTARAFLPGMVETKWGRVVNLTGMNAIHGYRGRAPVSAAKHGLWGLTKALAKEFGPHGITSNAISPGPIRSAHRDERMTHHIESMVKMIPLGHIGDPDHIAGLTGHLVSERGGFINGQMIACNGGGQT
ncbi:MAG: 3-oxoacyl-ACP reductase FabG [Hyphomicrobiaceae bacterium]